MLTTIRGVGRWARTSMATPAWSSGVGLARTLLAAGTAATMLATSPAVLMSPLSGSAPPPICADISRAGLWCLTPDNLALGRWVSIALLLVVASGWRPQVTAIPHWWVSWSLVVNATVQDGGDQITAVLTLLLLPICLTDTRRWHWQPAEAPAVPTLRHVIARVALFMVQIQVAIVYLHASLGKLAVAEWADGSVMYYWLGHPTFGSPPWLRPVTDLITDSPLGVTLMSWGSLALEFTLALAILLGARAKWVLLAFGIIFHVLIALTMGLISFGLAMVAALLLYLLPVGHRIVWPQRFRVPLRLSLLLRRTSPVPSPTTDPVTSLV